MACSHRPSIHARFALLAAALLVVMPSGSTAHRSSGAVCVSERVDATARLARDLLRCQAHATRAAAAVSPRCVEGADARFSHRMAHAERRRGCPVIRRPQALREEVRRFIDATSVALVREGDGRDRCATAELTAVGRRVSRLLRAHARSLRTGRLEPLKHHAPDGERRLSADFRRATAHHSCRTSAAVEEVGQGIDTFVDFVLASAGAVLARSVSLPSAARGAHTPGTPGVDGALYPHLVTQFGRTDFDLNRSLTTRFSAGSDERRPDAVLILIPGFMGGANSMKILAENLITRARESGFRIEVWAFDRRGQLIEDVAGLELAEQNADPQLGLDWLFGGELGLALDPRLPRRAHFHDAHRDTAFITDWTNLTVSRDIDAAVDAASAWARNGNVFLGGHSAGTGFTARYAATDFDLQGFGPEAPGYRKLRGLVLIEGGAGTTLGSQPSAEVLDRIEDRADGGLFWAAWNDAGSCVDGTPCSLSTEASDCAGLGRGTCTEAVTAYTKLGFSIFQLGPEVFASAELLGVQGISDPNDGPAIVQVDQGGVFGNRAIFQVPGLATLAVLNLNATAAGTLGLFLDDDSPVSSLATFIRTSMGGFGPPGPGGVVTWLGPEQGGLAPILLTDNGPAPVTGSSNWGVEKEVVRSDRLLETLYAGESNFLDWYFPGGGLGTTAELVPLDSTPLSVGRGRRDIENLTHAAQIDIPVIAFGGSNGLTPVGGSYRPFAESIAPCRAPSCDGLTPRIVEPTTPSESFPTFGGVAGGFEVYISEGLAHVDLVAAEDRRDIQLYGPLLDFLIRNSR